jgi:hypothetical protein
MGYQASCVLRIDGRSLRGTALLEQKELIFRGSERFVIPLEDVRTATADGTTLRIVFGARSAEIDVGAPAARWAERITNPPSRLDKLGIKRGMTVVVVGMRDEPFQREIEDRGARVASRAPDATADAIFYGANTHAALDRLPSLRRALKPAGALWVVRPKGRAEITEAGTMAAGTRAGLVDVKVVSFSNSHTAEKFVIPVAQRAPAGRSSSALPRRRGSTSSRDRS